MSDQAAACENLGIPTDKCNPHNIKFIRDNCKLFNVANNNCNTENVLNKSCEHLKLDKNLCNEPLSKFFYRLCDELYIPFGECNIPNIEKQQAILNPECAKNNISKQYCTKVAINSKKALCDREKISNCDDYGLSFDGEHYFLVEPSKSPTKNKTLLIIIGIIVAIVVLLIAIVLIV